MKILIMHSSLGSGGIESMVVNLANAMSKTQDVAVCTIYQPKKTDICYNRLSSNVHFISLGKQNTGFSLRVLFRIYSLIRKGGYDAVHLNGFFYYYALAVLFLHRKTSFFYTVHNDAHKENCLWDKYLIFLKRFCFVHNWMHAVTISKTSQDSFLELYNAPNTLIYNGVPRPNVGKANLLDYKLTDRTRILLNPARISTQKNQLMLCRVVKRLISEGFDCSLIIAGSNDDLSIFAQIKPYLSDRICYIGERDDIVEIMSSVHAMCLSSSWEGMPVTLIEALSVGCIPICTPVGGICDVVNDDSNGLLSDDISEDSYYNAVKRFLQMSDVEIKQMAENCINSFSKFDIETTSSLYLELFSKQ